MKNLRNPSNTDWYSSSMLKSMQKLSGALAFSGAFVALSLTQAHAGGTVAGTDITNVAEASFEGIDGSTVTIPSNTVVITVDELLDVTVLSADPGDIITAPDANDVVSTFILTNTGNGQESFRLTADTAVGGDDFDPTLQQIVLDTNGNGTFDPGVDDVYVAGTNDPDLAPDENIAVFIITSVPDDRVNGDRAEVSLLAEANTGTGAPGTSFDGQGQGGGDAVVGTTGADAEDSGFLAVQVANISLTKSATVLDPFGGDQAVPGSVITYRLVATTTGTGTIEDVVISDPIPASTVYVPASITLQTNALTDAADADAGVFDGTNISVTLGDVPAGETRTVTFEVTIE